MLLRSLSRASIGPIGSPQCLRARSSRGGLECRHAQFGRLTQKRWASNDKKPEAEGDAPFYIQLQESIYERVQKEKAEQIRIQSLQQRTARGQFFATITGKDMRNMLMMAMY